MLVSIALTAQLANLIPANATAINFRAEAQLGEYSLLVDYHSDTAHQVKIETGGAEIVGKAAELNALYDEVTLAA